MLARVVSKWLLLGMMRPGLESSEKRMFSAARPWWVGRTCSIPVMPFTDLVEAEPGPRLGVGLVAPHEGRPTAGRSWRPCPSPSGGPRRPPRRGSWKRLYPASSRRLRRSSRSGRRMASTILMRYGSGNCDMMPPCLDLASVKRSSRYPLTPRATFSGILPWGNPSTRATSSGVPWATIRPPASPPSGPEVHDLVGALDHIQVVLDDHHRVARVHQALEHGEEVSDVLEVEARGGLVEDVEGTARGPAATAPWRA